MTVELSGTSYAAGAPTAESPGATSDRDSAMARASSALPIEGKTVRELPASSGGGGVPSGRAGADRGKLTRNSLSRRLPIGDAVADRDAAAIVGAEVEPAHVPLGPFHGGDALQVTQRVLRNGARPARDFAEHRRLAHSDQPREFAMHSRQEFGVRRGHQRRVTPPAKEGREHDRVGGRTALEHRAREERSQNAWLLGRGREDA